MTKERRPLSEGLTRDLPPVDPDIARRFIHGEEVTALGRTEQATARPVATPAMGRSPISTRIGSDFVEALKRASLERQLHKVEPNTLQDILEEAIEPWLKKHGYLP